MAHAIRGLIAVFLLILYVYAIKKLVDHPTAEPVSQVRTILTVVGGLVSALIIAVLAVAPPTGPLANVFVDENFRHKWAVTAVTWGYVFVWLGCGAALLYFWLNPGPRLPVLNAVASEPSKTLDAAATSWLALAVAAAYAYLGLKKA